MTDIEKNDSPYCQAQVGGMECGQPVGRWGEQCERHGASGKASGSASGKRAGVFNSERAKAAAARSAEVRREKAAKRLDQGVGRARARSVSPLEALRDLLVADPKRYAAGVAAMLEKGDPRALGLMERLFQAEQQVDEPNTLDELAKLTREERRTLIRRLEAAGRATPFRR